MGSRPLPLVDLAWTGAAVAGLVSVACAAWVAELGLRVCWRAGMAVVGSPVHRRRRGRPLYEVDPA